MFRHLEDLKKRQNKEELVNKKQAKKRAEAKGRKEDTEAEAETTPTKVKRVEVEIEGQENEKENTCNMTENTVGKLYYLILEYVISLFINRFLCVRTLLNIK